MMLKIGVYFGSFDPIHRNHVGLCLDLLEHQGFEKVYLVPNQSHALKPYIVSHEHRCAMIEAAIAKHAGLELHRVENDNQRWEGRRVICEELRRGHGEIPQMFEI